MIATTAACRKAAVTDEGWEHATSCPLPPPASAMPGPTGRAAFLTRRHVLHPGDLAIGRTRLHEGSNPGATAGPEVRSHRPRADRRLRGCISAVGRPSAK